MRAPGFLLALGLALLAAMPGPVRAEEPAWLGATVETVTPEMMAAKELSMPFGARVTEVRKGSPAAKAGLRVGDIIISVDSRAVTDAAAFEGAIAKLAVGAKAQIVRIRGKEAPSTLKITRAQKPGSEARGRKAASVPPKTTDPPPILMLDTGGHMAMVWDVVFTPDGNFIVSAGGDKVIRVWDWRKGKTVRTIRGESGRGHWGKIFAIALSPDGKLLAVGGFMAPAQGARKWEVGTIRLYDFATGTLVGLLEGHRNVVYDLAFSPDGKRLVSGSFDWSAIIWDVKTRKLLHHLKGHWDSIYAVGFTPDGERVVSGSLDRTLQLWRVRDGTKIAALKGHNAKVRSLAINPRNGSIVSGGLDGEIRLWDGKTGKFQRILADQLANQGALVGALAINMDGSRLVSGNMGQSRENDRVHPVYVRDVQTGQVIATHGGHAGTTIAAAISPDGRLVATGGFDGEIHVWEIATGKRVRGPDGRPLALAGSGAPALATGFSADGQIIAWGNKFNYSHHNDRGPLELKLRLPATRIALSAPQRIAADGSGSSRSKKPFVRASSKHRAHTLQHRKGGDYGYDAILEVLKYDKVVARLEHGLTYHQDHRAYTFTPDGKTIVSGGGYGDIMAYRRAGVVTTAKGGTLKGAALNKLGRAFVGHESAVLAVTPSPDSRYLLSGSADQTVRLWNLATQELIVTLFYGRDGEWVMWTPQGYYTGSPGGGALVGWQLNKGPGKAAEYVRGQQLRKKLNRPDIVERAIILASAKAAVNEAGLEDATVEDILTQTPPVIELKANEEASGGYARINVKAKKNRLPLNSVAVFVGDGKQEAKVTPRLLASSGTQTETSAGGTQRSYEIPLRQGPNVIRVVATNDAGESAPQTITITHNGEGALDKRGTLWLFAAGVDKYPGARMYQDLNYAGKDAEAFAKTVLAEMRAGHERVELTVLINGGAQGEPTRGNIEAALKRVAENAKDQDTVIVFLAGHGENWAGGRYHFLPTDLKRPSRDVIGENVIDWETTIQGAVTKAKGRRLIFVDACRAGSAHNAKLLADALADRFVAFAATGPNQDAWEFETDEWGGGAFTLMLIYGLKGEALDPTQRAVTVYRLGTYVNEKVAEITQGKQTPEYQSGQGNFVLAR